MATKWVPWLMDDKAQRVRKLELGREFGTQQQVHDFFAFMHTSHPELVGQHVEFEEVTSDT